MEGDRGALRGAYELCSWSPALLPSRLCSGGHRELWPHVLLRGPIEALAPRARAEELARMLGGLEVTRKARAHAREMLGRARGVRAA